MASSRGGSGEEIRREIAARGPVTFERFMELALYAPSTGYYAQAGRVIGRGGDFYTSVSIGPVFGFLLAARFAEWVPSEGPLVWVEAAAHDGQLADDVLSALRGFWPEVFERVRYVILEPIEVRRREQQRRLEAQGDRVSWVLDWEAFEGPVRGIVFANELLDAFPVRRFGWDAGRGEWFEWGVDWDATQQRFDWSRLPARADPALDAERWPAALVEVLPDGFVVESCPGAAAWWDEAAARLVEGRLVTFDYGYEKGDGIRPERTNGTLRAYHRHRFAEDPLADPGERDLTAHVDFEAVRVAGERRGLVTESLLPQGRWLGEVVVGVLQRGGAAAEWLAARSRQLQTLVHPVHLGQAMKVLVQRREGSGADARSGA